jgi:hypothetical protein
VNEIMKYETKHGDVAVEFPAPTGSRRVGRGDGVILRAGERLEDVLAAVHPAVAAVRSTFDALKPAQGEVEFGVKLTTEAGAVIAKTAVEGHFVIRLTWQRETE